MAHQAMHVDIRRLGPGDEQDVLAAGALFDGPPDADATRRFLSEPAHHLLIAYGDAGRPLGFVSGVETTHPDKGTEMFLYELAVDASARRRGIGRALVEALVDEPAHRDDAQAEQRSADPPRKLGVHHQTADSSESDASPPVTSRA